MAGPSGGSQVGKHQECFVVAHAKGLDDLDVIEDHLEDGRGRRLADTEPQHLRGWTVEEGELAEVRVLRDDQVAVLTCVLPDLGVGSRRRARVL